MTSNLPQHDAVPSRLRAVKRRLPPPVKAAGRAGLRRFGVATAGLRVQPDFLIIGTKRGGTTSLWNWLLQHPGVLPMFPGVQQIKSPHYFDINFWRGPAWYRSHFPTRSRVAAFERSHGYRPVVGESSPYYMFHPAVARRVHDQVPTVKLIVLLRDPVKRAYSNYWERRGSGFEDLPTFGEALAAEETRVRGEEDRLLADERYYSLHHDCHTYRARGRYLEHLRPWLDLFPREQLHVIRSEDLYADPSSVVMGVHRFLGIPEQAPRQLPHHNKLRTPPIEPSLAEELGAYYEPHNRALAEVLGEEFRWR